MSFCVLTADESCPDNPGPGTWTHETVLVPEPALSMDPLHYPLSNAVWTVLGVQPRRASGQTSDHSNEQQVGKIV